nr:hypothetical protein [uncultured Dongia sp.]
MSGGNPLMAAKLAVFACAIMLGAGVTAVASGQDGPVFETGIAAANIAWAKSKAAETTLIDIAAAGFDSVRIGLKNPVTASYRALEQAKDAGLDVLVTIPLIDGAVAVDGASPRPRTENFFAAYGLSQIDLDRYRLRLEDLLAFVDFHQIPLIGLELGNELNWSGYNGDLPLLTRGAIIATDGDWHAADRTRFEAGLDRYRAVIDITREVLARYPNMTGVKLVSAGLADINSGFIRGRGATYVAPDLVYRAFEARQILRQVDVVGIHLYEPLRMANALSARAVMIDAQLDDCGSTGFAARPCWITEFGAALPQQDCAPDDARRISLMQPLLKYLAVPANAARVPLGFYYDWNDDAGFALVRCGRPTELTKILPRDNDGTDNNLGTP